MALRAAILLLFAPAASSGQENTRAEPVPAAIPDLDGAPRPSALAARAAGRIEIDGYLDEAAWLAAPVIDRFIQQKPAAGMPATERTEVRILYDDRNLYIGAELFDSEPASLVIPTLQRDPNTRDGDAFGISLDTFLDRKSAFAFVINPGGAVRDLQSFDDGRINNAAWEAAYRLKTRIHENGWTVEFAIPWSTLRFDARRDEQVWGLNLLRRVRRKNEDATWAPMDRQWQIYVMSRAGMLRGLDGIQPGRNLSVKPFVLTDHASGELRSATSTGFDAGGDLKYGITPGLTLDLTVNTDFSQVEVDQQQVNLTRFSLFFPEKREFFLENSGLFEFGDQGNYSQRAGVSNRDFTLFHSRRIGLTPSGAPLPIVTGGRVSGTAGPVSVGLLNMQTRARDEFQPENFTVARLRAEAAPGLTAGGIFINRSATSGTAVGNRSYGADLNYQAFKDYLLVQSYIAATEGSRIDGTPLDRSFAGRVSATWRDPFWEVMAMYRQFDPDFDPGVGFVRRTGIRHGYGTIGIRQRTAGGFLQELNPYVEMHRYTDFDGLLETREAGGGLDIEFGDGATARIGITDRFERVIQPFTIGNASVPAGTYDFTEASATYDASRARALSGRVSVSGGGYFGGDRYTVSGSVLGRIGYRALLDISAQHNRIDLPGQAPTTADVYGARFNAFFSTRLLTSAFVQYNQATREFVSNVRLNWIHAPLSDLYVVLTERRDTQGDRVLERLVSVKATRLLSF
jgi:hypothetical protein